jgi:tRNA modification GTPase
MPGTTRDCVAGRVMLDGLAVDWLDTPGIRDTDDAIEMQSRAIARTLAQRADLVIGIDAPDAPLPADCTAIVARAPDIVVRTKGDMAGRTGRDGTGASAHAVRAGGEEAHAGRTPITVSALARTGLDDLAVAVRRGLVPDADLEHRDPWIFDPALA